MVGNVLYLSTMYTRVTALDAETGAELWIFDPRAYEGGPKGAGPRGFKHRGIAWWHDGDDARIFTRGREGPLLRRRLGYDRLVNGRV